MPFAPLRRRRYIALILTRAEETWQLHRGMLLEMELIRQELSLSVQDILATYCTKIPLVRRN